MPVWQKIQEPLTQGANLGEVVGINRILKNPLLLTIGLFVLI